MFKAGDFIYAYFRFIKPRPKYKYAICVSPEHPLFFFVNTRPRTSAPKAQIYVSKFELSYLSHDSYINTAQPITISQSEIDNAEVLGPITSNLKQKIKAVVEVSSYLSPRLKNLIISNLSEHS